MFASIKEAKNELHKLIVLREYAIRIHFVWMP